MDGFLACKTFLLFGSRFVSELMGRFARKQTLFYVVTTSGNQFLGFMFVPERVLTIKTGI